jgi:hypothetical protein
MDLDFITIFSAVMGDHDAIEEVLKYYDAYINKLCTFNAVYTNGTQYTYVDFDAVQLLQKRLAEQIPKWKEICK